MAYYLKKKLTCNFFVFCFYFFTKKVIALDKNVKPMKKCLDIIFLALFRNNNSLVTAIHTKVNLILVVVNIQNLIWKANKYIS